MRRGKEEFVRRFTTEEFACCVPRGLHEIKLRVYLDGGMLRVVPRPRCTAPHRAGIPASGDTGVLAPCLQVN